MSVVVGVRKGGTIAIAADSQTTQGDTILPGDAMTHPDKIQRLGNACFSVVGSAAHQHVISSLYRAHPELFDLTDEIGIFETFRNIHERLVEDYYLITKEDDEQQEYESNQMFGIVVSSKGLFSFQSYREVTEFNAFWAAGSGADFALGSMESTYALWDDPLRIAEEAVRVACRFDRDCGLPHTSCTMELDA